MLILNLALVFAQFLLFYNKINELDEFRWKI